MGICLRWSSDECKKAVSRLPKPASSTLPTLRSTAAIHHYETKSYLEIGMGCTERDRLLDLLLAALKAHSDAVEAIPGCKAAVSTRARKLATKAEATYRDCREALIAHERSHGCAPKPSSQKN